MPSHLQTPSIYGPEDGFTVSENSKKYSLPPSPSTVSDSTLDSDGTSLPDMDNPKIMPIAITIAIPIPIGTLAFNYNQKHIV